MAIVIKNFLTRGLSGTLGKTLVFKRIRGRTVVSCYPDRSRVVLSERQVAANQKFKEAVAFARQITADPEKKAAFARNIKKGKSVYHAAIRVYMKG